MNKLYLGLYMHMDMHSIAVGEEKDTMYLKEFQQVHGMDWSERIERRNSMYYDLK